MDTASLEQDIIDQMVELQIKLGYAHESTRLYYKPESLGMLVGVDEAHDASALVGQLQAENALAGSPLGEVSFGTHENRVEVRIPPQGALYVHEQVPEPPFLLDLINLFNAQHHPSQALILALFAKHGAFNLEEMPPDADFDYAVHFCDVKIDSHYYCFKEEMGHTIYHRFAYGDYRLLLED